VAPDANGFVGYRVRERLGSVSAPNDVVGRSPAVSGTVTIAGGTLTAAEVTVDMTRLRTDVEPRDGRMREEGLETDRFRTAGFRLRRPIPLGDVSGARVVELELTLVRKGAALAGPVSTLGRATAVPQAGGEKPGRPQGPPCRGGRRLPEGGGRLLFTAIADGGTEQLFTIGADGRGLRRVGRDDANQLDPTWSPDGRRIAYVRAEPYQSSPPPSVHVIRADGSGRRDLTPGEASSQPDWSPDGRRLSFVRDGNLFVTRPDGSGAACLRVGMLLTSGARWQPGP